MRGCRFPGGGGRISDRTRKGRSQGLSRERVDCMQNDVEEEGERGLTFLLCVCAFPAVLGSAFAL